MSESSKPPVLNWSDFTKVDIRVGTILRAEVFEKARKPAYKIWIDFGELGVKKTSAQITEQYDPDKIMGVQVAAVVNFPPKQIADFMSECLLLGAMGPDKEVILLHPERPVPNGWRVG